MKDRYPLSPLKLTSFELETLGNVTHAALDEALGNLTNLEWADGMSWYRTANVWAQGVAKLQGLSTRQVAWMVALLSPLNNWDQNKQDVIDLILTGECGALPLGSERALAVLAGEDGNDIAGGRKVRSFGRNIAMPLNSWDVTLDTHMVNVLGLPSRGYLDRRGVYDTIANVFRDKAYTLGVMPHQLQAAVWLHERN